MWVPGAEGKAMFKDRRLMLQELKHETGWILCPKALISGKSARWTARGEVTARGPLLSKASLAVRRLRCGPHTRRREAPGVKIKLPDIQ